MGVESLIALGGNLGDVEACLFAACNELDALPKSRVCKKSLLYRSKPIGPSGQPDYLNAALLMETSLTPQNLLACMHAIENRHGRVRSLAWGARTLDLDLIAYDNLTLSSPELTLPHAHMHERIFVLQPLCDIRPGWQHPHMKMTAAAMLARLIPEKVRQLSTGKVW